MALQHHGRIPQPDHTRIHRADEPRLRQPIPALNAVVENANQTLDKAITTLNRAGSNPRNPILSGLAGRFEFGLSILDSLRAVYIFQEHSNPGTNLISSVVQVAPGRFALDDHLYGGGVSVAGSPATGAKRNFIRVKSKFGTVEKEFWVKTKDADIIAIDGKPALNLVTLLPKTLDVFIVDASRPWIQLPIDFFVSWNDEFQVLHNAKNPFLDPGFLKAYGGAKFVSFFDTTPGTEGVGVAVNPVTEAQIEDQHLIEVQNTAGLKEITVRFRSKQGSLFFVDCPIKLNVIAPPVVACNPPVVGPPETCTSVLLTQGTPLPADTPSVPSTVGNPTVAGTVGQPLSKDLIIVTVRAAVVGASPTLRIQKWKWLPDAKDVSGGWLDHVGASFELIPLQLTSAVPVAGPPYGAPVRMTIAFDRLQDSADNVAFYTVSVNEGGLLGNPMLVPGPKAREVQFFPAGETGGGSGDLCVY